MSAVGFNVAGDHARAEDADHEGDGLFGNAGDMDEGRRDVAEDGEHAPEADRRDRQRQPDLWLLQRAEFA